MDNHADQKSQNGTDPDACPYGDLLHESYDLAGLTQEWRKFFHLGVRHAYPRGAIIANGGEKVDRIYYLEQGEVRLVRSLVDGKEKILFRMHQGMLVGEVPFLDGLPSMSSLVAATNSTLYSFERSVVENRIFPESPALMFATMRAMASKIRMLCNQSVDISTVELSTRICRFIAIRSRNGAMENQRRVNLALNQQELSSLLGVHRVTLNKALRELENRGVIGAYSRKGIDILDEQRLLALANLD